MAKTKAVTGLDLLNFFLKNVETIWRYSEFRASDVLLPEFLREEIVAFYRVTAFAYERDR